MGNTAEYELYKWEDPRMIKVLFRKEIEKGGGGTP
jgi:hypothetical protein